MLPLRVALVTFPFTSGINCMGFILAFMFLTEATQYFVHGGLQQIRESLATKRENNANSIHHARTFTFALSNLIWCHVSLDYGVSKF